MTDQFLGEIRAFGFGYAPRGWALCAGQSMPINQNVALFSLLGVIYGGDGRSTFNLPNLQGKVPMFYGQGVGLSNYVLGQTGGVATVTLSPAQMAGHAHNLQATTANATSAQPGGLELALGEFGTSAPLSTLQSYKANTTPTTAMNSGSLGNMGGNQPHNNMMPYTVLTFCIALQGIFPTRS